MTDIQMIEFIAECWTDNGGDSEGFAFLQTKILERIRSIETFEREERERNAI
jgi:hypothetical protein